MKYNLHLKKATALAIATRFVASSSLVGCSNSGATSSVGAENTTERKYIVTEKAVDCELPPLKEVWASWVVDTNVSKFTKL